jgi:PAS domain S-box-containing protein
MAEKSGMTNAPPESDLFRFMIENVKDYAIFMLDAEGRVATWNAGAEHMFGYLESEIVGQPFSCFFTPEDIQSGRPKKELATAQAAGRAADEGWRVRKDGSRFWASGVNHPLRDGDLKGFVKVVRDLTERKQVEDRLREETEIAETLNGIGTDLVRELDLHKLLQKVTDEATKLTHAEFGAFLSNAIGPRSECYSLYSLRGLLQEALADFPIARNAPLFDPTFRGAGVVRLDDVSRDPRYRQTALRSMPGHGPVKSYLAVPVVSSSGTVLGGLFFGHSTAGVFSERVERLVVGIAAEAAVAIDNARLYQEARLLSEELRRQNEELAESDRRKNEFLAMLGHELRNPLAPIVNALHIIRSETQANPLIEQAASMAERQTRHLARVVDDLLDLARITRGAILLRKERVSLADVVNRAVETVQPTFDAQGQRLSVSYPRETIWLEGDPIRLQQVLVNLLNNAAKYTPRDGRIWCAAQVQGRDAVLRIKDTGVGIAPELLSKVFDLFTQAERSLARSEGGLGIGLTMVRQLVEMHGGSVEARSAGVGRGSEFIVRLPVVEVEQAGAQPAQHPDGRTGRSLRILVVDDNVDAAASLAIMLRLYGHDVVDIAHTGPAAVDAVLARRPEVVLLDIGLPGIDGFQVAQKIREHFSSAEVKLIALTGYSLENDRQRSAAVGFDHHIVKPIEPGSLERLLAEVAPAAR